MDSKERPSFNRFSLDELKELKDHKRKDLTIKPKETLNLTADSKDFKDYFKLISVKDIDVVKNLIGISDEIVGERNCGCAKLSRIPSLKDLEVKDKELRNKNFAAARVIANQYIYGNSKSVNAYKALLNRYLEISKAKIPIFWFLDIIVHDHATLNIANNVLNVSARKIMLYGNGKITYTGPTTFNCKSFEGNL